MIATAVMWYSISKIHVAEAEHGLAYGENETYPLYLCLGPLLLDGVAFYWISQAVMAL